MFIHISFVTLIFALSAFGTPMKRDATQVMTDIEGMKNQTNSLDKAINDLPSGGATPAQAMAIHDEATELASAIKGATNDVTDSPKFDNSQAKATLEEIQTLGNDIVKALQDLDDKKASLEAMKPIVATDLASLGNDTQAFDEQLVKKIPTSMQSIAQAQVTAVAAAFKTAQDTYAS